MFYSRSISLKHNTLSSCESELGASAEATQDIIWMRKLFEQLGFPQHGPTTLYTDNASLVTLATAYSGNHKRVRHFVTRLNWMISKVEDGIVQLIHMPGCDMPADMLTKPLAKEPFEKHRKRIFNVASSTFPNPSPILSPSSSSSILRIPRHDFTCPTYDNYHPAPSRTRKAHFPSSEIT